ncbi:DUF1156 domain-containing protein [Desulfosoma caldarium]|uniref:GIY-YIG catalytic domain-containing protein n=1 Tax=Desulfosoma caldarium TaxID=610254 RepID=A0A3N1UQ64_9BACT|nr:DUF1156 domain-containing protein [Desulfosoma caldarium]ROQ90900.1 GIY-YIG catalytic domain-containing protein [Desulfosoma caldarium]
MIPKECKRLAEVDFPIADVSKHAAREKSIRHGHPSTLHLWWARRPLASCRAVLLGLLLPDPADPHCPDDFKAQARRVLATLYQGAAQSNDGDLRRWLLKFIADFANWDLAANRNYLDVSRALVKAAHKDETPLVVDPFAGGGSIPLEALRLGCEAFASDLNPVACLILKVMLEDIPRHGPKLAEELRRVGAEIKKKAEEELAELYPCLPEVEDRRQAPHPEPGKSYVYALRCSDKSIYIGLADDIPRRIKQHEAGGVDRTSRRLPVELVYWEKFDSREEAAELEKKLKSGSGREWLKKRVDAPPASARASAGKPIAYLWARTVRCESPNCGAEIPLVRSFWLCKKANRKWALRYQVKRYKEKGKSPEVEFEVFAPESEKDVPNGTVTRARATCLCCGAVLPPERVRAQLAAQRGGADVVFDHKGRRTGGARLLAVVTLRPGEQGRPACRQGRHYRLPTERDYQAVWKAQQRLKAILDEWERGGRKGLCPVPDEPTPEGGGSGAGRAFSVQKYGMLQWGDLFTARQKVALVTLVRLLTHPPTETEGTHKKVRNQAVRGALAFALSKLCDFSSSLSRWANHMEKSVATFSRQALPILWDWGEVLPIGASSGSLVVAVDWAANALSTVVTIVHQATQVQLADATEHPLPDDAATVWFTDPPYYDAVPYADLSDFFFVWLKRALPGHPLLRDPFNPENPLTPKDREVVQDERSQTDDGRPKDKAFYEEAMARAFAEGRRILREDGIASVVFAHKTTEGWEALLSGMIRAGWTITGSWPIATEKPDRMRAMESAALATSVHLVCRPRPEDAPVGDWADVLRELPKRVGDWMERLQQEGIRGADLVFACIGPALEIFSRYSRVETADGREVKLAEYLEKVWEVVGRTALENVLGTAEAKARNGVAGALEEDARLTALFLWTLQSTNGQNGPGGKADEEANDEDGGDEDEEETTPRGKAKGYSLVFDVVRRFAQPLGIDLPRWEGRIIETKKGVVRLLSIHERAKVLFGKDGAEAIARRLEKAPAANTRQLVLFMNREVTAKAKGRGRGRRKPAVNVPDLPAATHAAQAGEALETSREATTLDRVHMAMLLQAGGRANALRALLKAEQGRGPDFLRLANALSALYPKGSEEKRLLDAMLLAVPR